jgi:hypothetical protein
MKQYQYKLKIGSNEENVTIYRPSDDDGFYKVEWQTMELGYIYFDKIDEDLGSPIWKGNSNFTSMLAPEFGKYIEHKDLYS